MSTRKKAKTDRDVRNAACTPILVTIPPDALDTLDHFHNGPAAIAIAIVVVPGPTHAVYQLVDGRWELLPMGNTPDEGGTAR